MARPGDDFPALLQRSPPVSDTPTPPVPPAPPLRRDEEVALELMKFVATTTGYGRNTSGAAGFQGSAPSHAADYAQHLLELYGQCLAAVRGK
jgi:hypothetical protein